MPRIKEFGTSRVVVGAIFAISGIAMGAEITNHVPVTFTKDIAPILQGLPQSRRDGADVAAHLPGSAALGEVDQGARRHAADATLVSR